MNEQLDSILAKLDTIEENVIISQRERADLLRALKETVTDRNAHALASESLEAAFRRLCEINRVALKAIAKCEEVEC